MLRVVSCIAHEHDLRLVGVAAVICLLATFIAFASFQQARRDATRRPFYLGLAALVSGLGIWSTHFVAMLAYQPGLPIGYDFAGTLLSIVAAVLITGLGWTVALNQRPAMAPLGGAIVGGGVATMHYIGMAAVQVAGEIVWDRTLVAVSVALGVLLAAAAVATQRAGRRPTPWAATLLLTGAICSLHFTAMAAAVIHPSNATVPLEAIDTKTLALIVIVAMAAILAIGFGLMIFDRRLARAQLAEAEHRAALAEEVMRAAAEREVLTADLQRQADITNAALGNMAQGLSMLDANLSLITFNHRFAELYGVPAELLVPGTPLASIIGHLVSSGVLPDTTEYYLNQARNSTERGAHLEIQLLNGRIIEVQHRLLPQGGVVATHDDVTEARRTNYMATHDGLTGLLNRAAFAECLSAAVASAGPQRQFAVHTIDLDRFKEVNDTLGHAVGDHILRQTAARLRQMVREADVITRLGGDEFAVLQTHVDDVATAAALASRIVEKLGEPFELEGHTVIIGASVGISLASDALLGGDDILKMSDLALYRAKTDSRGAFRFFEPSMYAQLRERRQLENDLRAAIREGQFDVHYQPLINLGDGAIECFEALLRWHHPSRGTIHPADFMTVAEDTSLIVQIGEWVLREACHHAATWPAELSLAVNLSPAQFKRGDLIALVTSALSAAGLEPHRLELEITETVLLHDEDWVRSLLDQLTALGVRIAMDDFGTGYSGLSYLRSFPFSKIKIDRSFVADLANGGDALAIVQAIVQLSRKLGIETTAEGVETAEQLEILRAEGCAQAQGFHISRAVPAGEVAGLLALHNPRTMRMTRLAS